MKRSKTASAPSKPARTPKPGAFWIQPFGSLRWRIAELHADRLWYVAGESEPFAIVRKHISIDPPPAVLLTLTVK